MPSSAGAVGGQLGVVGGTLGVVGHGVVWPTGPPPPPSFTDTFSRPNASPLGAPWVEHAQSGTAGFGVTGGEAVTTRQAGAADVLVTASVDLGTPIGITEWDMSTWGKGPVYSMFRFVDLDNMWFVSGSNSASGTMYLFRRSAGANTMLASTTTAPTWGAGHRLAVEDAGTLVTVKVDGVAVAGLTSTDTTHSTATRSAIGGNTRSAGPAGSPWLYQCAWTRFHIEGR